MDDVIVTPVGRDGRYIDSDGGAWEVARQDWEGTSPLEYATDVDLCMPLASAPHDSWSPTECESAPMASLQNLIEWRGVRSVTADMWRAACEREGLTGYEFVCEYVALRDGGEAIIAAVGACGSGDADALVTAYVQWLNGDVWEVRDCWVDETAYNVCADTPEDAVRAVLCRG